MVVSVRIEVHNTFMQRLLRSPAGPVVKNMLSRGRRVRDAARRNVNSRTGALASSIEVSITTSGGVTGAQIGTNLFYAKYVHDGTGIYGPSGQPIRPRSKKALEFQGSNGTVFSRYSVGQRGTKFLERALRAAG